MKDLFEIIDIRKDGKIDKHEWNQTFAAVSPFNPRFKQETGQTLLEKCLPTSFNSRTRELTT